jgi:glycosyltransferase involved in cell wall biosynthesis
MRIALIHPFFYRYARGIERFTANLANALTRCGVEVDVITWRWRDPIQIDSLDPRVRVRTFRTGRYFSAKVAVPYYVWQLLVSKYDFVWIFFAGYGEGEALTLVGRQSFGIVFHYPYIQVPHRYREFEHCGLSQRAAQIVSVSEYVAEGVRQAFGRTSTVIHNGVDSKRFSPNDAERERVKAELGLAAGSPVLVSMAALEERKGIQWVLRALPQAIRQFPNLTYLVLGDGPSRGQLGQLASELGIQNAVKFLGARTDIVPYYQAADLLLLLSRGEASPLAIPESMACGVPVITSRHRPFDEYVKPEWGLQVEEEDHVQVAEAIIGLLSNPRRRAEMGTAGRSRVLLDFTWERIGQQYLNLMQT